MINFLLLMCLLSIWRAEIKLKTHLLFYSQIPQTAGNLRCSTCLLVALYSGNFEHVSPEVTGYYLVSDVLAFIYGFREHMHMSFQSLMRVSLISDEEAIHQAHWDTASLTCFPNICWLQSTWPVHCICVTWMYDSPEAVHHCHHHGALDIFMYLWLY